MGKGRDSVETVRKLDSLLRVEIDAVHAYGQAIKRVDLPSVQARLEAHRDDHLRHIDALSRLIRTLGGAPTERTHTFKGFLTRGFTMVTIQGFASVRSVRDTEAALLTMEGNEKLVNKAYIDAMAWEVEKPIHDTIEAAYRDEREHLVYIQKHLGHRVEIDPYHPHAAKR
jgi:rubrerythrin